MGALPLPPRNSDGQSASDGEGYRCDYPLVLQVTTAGAQAHARLRRVSIFTRALVRGLNGLAGTDYRGKEGRWVVETGRLAMKMQDIIRLDGAEAGRMQPSKNEDFGDSAPIHYFDRDPVVAVSVDCNPDRQLHRVELSIDPKGLRPGRYRRDTEKDPEKGPWRVSIKGGINNFRATFARKGRYGDYDEWFLIEPPTSLRNLQLKPRPCPQSSSE